MTNASIVETLDRTNVLIMGKSGVGKSSLLNYMFGKEIQPVGTGAPVTKAELNCFDYKYDENFCIRIYDTWGLEPGADRAAAWKKTILEEVHRQDKKSIKDWFNTIIFCLSRNSDRVEDFEVEIIKGLVREKNQVAIVITHCQSKDDEKAKTLRNAMVNRLHDEGIDTIKETDFVFVSNVQKKLLTGSVEQFGKEDVFAVIIHNVWNSFRVKVPYLARLRLEEAYKKNHDEMMKDAERLNLYINRTHNINKFEDRINERCKNFVTDISSDINTMIIDAFNYYGALCRKYSVISNGAIIENSISQIDFRYKANSAIEKQITIDIENLRKQIGIIDKILENKHVEDSFKSFLIELKTSFSDAKEIKEHVKTSLEAYMLDVYHSVRNSLDEVSERIQSIDFDEFYYQSQMRNEYY